MKNRICIVLMIISFAGCSGFWPFDESDHVVRVRGTQLEWNGHPYYFSGTNFWYGPYLGAPGPRDDRERLRRELDSLCANGIRNLRVLGGSERSDLAHVVTPAITHSPGDVDDTLLIGLDFLLAEMGKRKVKAVIFFSNYWEWSGGFTQYLAWANGTKTFDPNVLGWGPFMDFSASFYSHEKANAYYRDYVRRIVTRTNTVNGRRYNEDPAIMSWQLANEPRPGTNGPEAVKNLPSFYQWIDSTAGFIKSLDTLHLVSTGNEGLAGSDQNGDVFLQAHRSPHIDYLTMHLWAYNWGWFDPQRPDSTFAVAVENATEYIQQHLAFARTLGKPLVMEEFGIGRDGGVFDPASSVSVRDRYYRTIFDLVYDSARSGAPIAGTNFWAWGGEARAAHPDFWWKPGDPFMGDPPQEPQGMNAVFMTDSTTLSIIRSHAHRMSWLGVEDTLVVTHPHGSK